MTPACASMPGLRGTEHVGFTVPDLVQATDFFVNVIGCEVFFESGPFAGNDEWMKSHLNLGPGTVIKKYQLLRCGFGTNFEIFEYQAPDQNRQGPRNSDIGGHHLAFYVDDIDAAADYLKAKGVRVLGEPKCSPPGPTEGQKWVYFLAPWGMQLELVSFPNGRAYEKTTAARLWHPAQPHA